MKYFKYLFVIVIVIFITGCDNNKESKDKFYAEYSKYNNSSDYVNVELDNSNIFKYNVDAKKVFQGNSIIFIGSANDNKARIVANVLDKVISNTDINAIYYYNNIDSIKEYLDEDIEVPVVIFVMDGKVEVDNYIVNENDKLNDDEELELYNRFLNGVHMVLGDVCDEEC